MKTTSTLRNLLGAGILLCAGGFPSFAQSNMATAAPTFDELQVVSRTYTASFDENVVKSGEYDMITVTSSSPGLVLGNVVNADGRFQFNFTLPNGGLPVGAGITLYADDKPLWHVTVADILGQTEGEHETHDAMRPIDITDVVSQDNDNSISHPTLPQAVNSVNPGGNKPQQPKMDVFPNPATDFIMIVTEGEVLWGVTEVIDITGKKILEIPTGANSPAAGLDKITISVAQLKPGTYFLRFKTNKDVYTKRFQVAR